MDKGQQTKFSQAEQDLLRSTFKGDGIELLYQVRKVFLQFDYDKDSLKVLSPDVLSILRKELIPELDRDTPISHQSDLYFALGNIKEILPEVALKHIEGMDLVYQYLLERWDVLEGGEDKNSLKLNSFKHDGDRFVGLYAFMVATTHIEKALGWFKTFCIEEETEAQKAARLAKDSTQ
jgi:hypothetical protein